MHRSSQTSYSNDDTLCKHAYNMSQHFKNTKYSFSGNTGETIEEYFETYETSSIDYKLTSTLQFQYLHNVFDGEAKRYYRDKITLKSINIRWI